MITKLEKRIQKSNTDQSYNAIIKCRKRDLKAIKKALENIPHDILLENFSLEEYYNSKI